MVKIMENPIKMNDLGGKHPYFWKHPYFQGLNLLLVSVRFTGSHVCRKGFVHHLVIEVVVESLLGLPLAPDKLMGGKKNNEFSFWGPALFQNFKKTT